MTERDLTVSEMHEWAFLCAEYWRTVPRSQMFSMADIVERNQKLWEFFSAALDMRWQKPPNRVN